MENKEL